MNQQEGAHGIHTWADLKYRIYHTCHRKEEDLSTYIHYYVTTITCHNKILLLSSFDGILPTKFN